MNRGLLEFVTGVLLAIAVFLTLSFAAAGWFLYYDGRIWWSGF